MARTGLGWYPGAEQIEGVISFASEHLPNVGFCDHAAGGFYSTMQNPAFWNNAGVSTHFAVARDGRVCQMVNIFDSAWAQGRLGPTVTWAPYYAHMNQQNPNLYLISTEHEDWVLVNGKARAVPGSEWTPEQYAADLKLKQWCIEECMRKGEGSPLQYGADSLTGHFMFDSVNRAQCPGLFWTRQYRAQLFSDLAFGGVPMPSDNDQILALVALAHFIRNGWNLDDLSPEDKAAIAAAAARVPQ